LRPVLWIEYAATLPKPHGKAIQRGLFKGGWQPVDEFFLEELDGYRAVLARNLKNHNSELDGETLTEINPANARPPRFPPLS